MWYKSFGILLLTVVLFHSIWLTITDSFSTTIFGGLWGLNIMFIPIYLILATVLYFSAVKDNQDIKDAAERAAIAGGLAFMIIMGGFRFLSIEGKNRLYYLSIALLSHAVEGAVISSAAAATTVAINNL